MTKSFLEHIVAEGWGPERHDKETGVRFKRHSQSYVAYGHNPKANPGRKHYTQEVVYGGEGDMRTIHKYHPTAAAAKAHAEKLHAKVMKEGLHEGMVAGKNPPKECVYCGDTVRPGPNEHKHMMAHVKAGDLVHHGREHKYFGQGPGRHIYTSTSQGAAMVKNRMLARRAQLQQEGALPQEYDLDRKMRDAARSHKLHHDMAMEASRRKDSVAANHHLVKAAQYQATYSQHYKALHKSADDGD